MDLFQNDVTLYKMATAIWGTLLFLNIVTYDVLNRLFRGYINMQQPSMACRVLIE